MPSFIEARELRKTFRVGKVDVPALRGISFSVEKGEFVTVVGPSGSGKSTLFYLLGGLTHADSGSVLIDSVDFATLSDSERTKLRKRKIGFVFQKFNLLPTLSARSNIEIASDIAGKGAPDQQFLTKITGMLGIDKRLDHRPNELSGGEQQRVALARALINRPSIVLADEPTGNLDSKSSKIVLNMLRQSNKDLGQTILMITHNPEAAAYGDRIIHMRDGEIVTADEDPQWSPHLNAEPLRPPEHIVREHRFRMAPRDEATKPILPGKGATDYERYLRTDELLALQKLPEELLHKDEMTFLVVHQSSELLMKGAAFELGRALAFLEQADYANCTRLIRRAISMIEPPIALLHILETITPHDYHLIRAGLGHGSGLDSPGFLSLLHMGPRLGKAFQDKLSAAGIGVDELYRRHEEFFSLHDVAERLLDFDERMQIFRFHHLKLAERIIGGRVVGTMGTPVEVLQQRMESWLYKDLWDVRNRITANVNESESRKQD